MSSFTRRSFLKSSLAAGVFPLILPRRLWGETAPSNTINVAMIGVGRQTLHSNLQTFLNFKEVRVVAVCDVDGWRMEQVRNAVDAFYVDRDGSSGAMGCATYKDFQEVLKRSDVDAVMISTPDHWHVPMAIAAARAGKDIACEKPLTLSIAEGRRLSNVIRETGRVFRTDSEFRSLSIMQRACQIVRNGRIGRLQRIITSVPTEPDTLIVSKEEPIPQDLDYDLWLGPARVAPYQVERVHPPHVLLERPGWMRIKDYADGTISNWGTHLNDIAQWGNNTDDTGPIEVEAVGTFPKDGTLWNTLIGFDANFQYANGVKLHFTMDRPYIRFEGDEGWVEADYSKMLMTASSTTLVRYKPGPDELHLPLRTEKTDFIESVKSRKRTLADAEVGHRTNTISHLALISIALGGRRLRWDPVQEIFPDDPEANKLLDRPCWREPWGVAWQKSGA